LLLINQPIHERKTTKTADDKSLSAKKNVEVSTSNDTKGEFGKGWGDEEKVSEFTTSNENSNLRVEWFGNTGNADDNETKRVPKRDHLLTSRHTIIR